MLERIKSAARTARALVGWDDPPGDFTLVLNANGVRFTEVSTTDWVLREELLNTLYPNPEAAEEAATGRTLAEEGEIVVQHAVAICTHFDNVISFGGGSRRHVTDFLRHEDGRHYTITRHQKYVSGAGWLTTDRFRYSARRSYCGCG